MVTVGNKDPLKNLLEIHIRVELLTKPKVLVHILWCEIFFIINIKSRMIEVHFILVAVWVDDFSSTYMVR